MKGFQFRLEPVLRVRRHALEQCRLALAKARRALREALATRSACDAVLREAQAICADRMAQGLPGGELRERRNALAHALGELAQAEAAAVAAEQQVTAALAAVTHARREVRALEILREKALTEYRREAARREQAELDEVASRVRGLEAAW